MIKIPERSKRILLFSAVKHQDDSRRMISRILQEAMSGKDIEITKQYIKEITEKI